MRQRGRSPRTPGPGRVRGAFAAAMLVAAHFIAAVQGHARLAGRPPVALPAAAEGVTSEQVDAAAPESPPAPEPLPTALTLEGIQAPVEVIRDRYGVVHIYASTEADAAFAVGFLQAWDRLFQMDVGRRRAEGTLAELLGPGALSEDVQMRTLGLARAAERSWTRLSEGARSDLEAYSRGVNAYIARARVEGRLPPEYAALELSRVRPWRPVDSLSILKLVGFSLSFHLDAPYAAILQAYVEALGPERGGRAVFEDLWRLAPADSASVVPDAAGYGPRVQGSEAPPRLSAPPGEGPSPFLGRQASGGGDDWAAGARLAAQWMAEVADLPAFAAALYPGRSRMGSNWFLIGPRLSASGYPILANDPHLPLTAPPVWYPQHVVVTGPNPETAGPHEAAGSRDGAERTAPSIDVAGVAFPGVPWVILGFNRRLAWGATTNPVDVTDTYVERLVERDGRLFTEFRGQLEPVQVLPQRFRVNQVGDQVLDNLAEEPPGRRVPEAVLEVERHGPVVRIDRSAGRALSVQWAGFYATHDGESFYRWNRASNLDEFLDGLEYFDAASQNWAYADADGNVAYFAGGEVPLREDLDDGYVDGGPSWAPFLLRDGTGLRRHQWKQAAGGRPLPPHQGLPFEVLVPSEMAHIVNPRSGFIVSANNDPIGTTLDGDPLNDRRANGGLYYLAAAYDPGFRAGRITERILERARRAGRLSVEDAMAIQSDVVQLSARRLLPHLLSAWQAAAVAPEAGAARQAGPLSRFRTAELEEAIGYLRGWDFSTPTGVPEGYDAADRADPGQPVRLGSPEPREIRHSVAATLFNLWVSQLIRNTLDAALARISTQLPRPDGAMAVKALIFHLEAFEQRQGRGASGIAWFDIPDLDLPPATERDILLLQSLQDALALLKSGEFEAAFGGRDLSNARWGRLHRVTFEHPLGPDWSVPPRGGFEYDAYRPGIPVDGGFEVVDASGFDPRAAEVRDFGVRSGPSVRLVVEMRPEGPRAFAALPGSLTGNPDDLSYFDLLPVWLANDYFPFAFRREDVLAFAASRHALEPAASEAPGQGAGVP